MPESLSTDPQVLQQLDKLAFINSIQFGRKVILVIESNIDYDKLQEAIDNLLKSKEVSQKELAILANSNIRLMTIGNKGIKISTQTILLQAYLLIYLQQLHPMISEDLYHFPPLT